MSGDSANYIKSKNHICYYYRDNGQIDKFVEEKYQVMHYLKAGKDMYNYML